MSNIYDHMTNCTLCRRNCGVNRAEGQVGVCGQTSDIRICRAALHMWEEPCISGNRGSGTVFFAGCSLHCVYCQNYAISMKSPGKAETAGTMATTESPETTAESTESATESSGSAAETPAIPGRVVTIEELSDIFMDLEKQGANNINLVTPTHFVPQIATALRLSRSRGLGIPIVYNTGSYDNTETLKLLDGLVDIYLPDLKYYSPELGQRYSMAADYFTGASAAISEMVRQVGEPEFAEVPGEDAPIMKKGVIVRHLVLPDHTDDSENVIKYLYETYKDMIYISILHQYTPVSGNPGIYKFPELNRTITDEEYDTVVDYAIDLGVENGFIQESGADLESFIPAWDI